MKKPMDYVYRFCNKHPNFGIPNLMKYIVGGNVVFWLLVIVALVLIWFLLAFAFRGIGKFWFKIYDDAAKEIKRED